MIIRPVLRLLSILAVALFFNFNSASANLLVNQSFESPAVTGPLGYNYRLGLDIPGWSVVSPQGNAGLPQFNSSYAAVGDGLYAVQLDDPGEGIEQTVSLIPGTTYEVSFLLAGYNTSPATTSVSIAGSSWDFVTSSLAYTEESFTFTATSTSDTLRFLNAGAHFTYPHLIMSLSQPWSELPFWHMELRA